MQAGEKVTAQTGWVQGLAATVHKPSPECPRGQVKGEQTAVQSQRTRFHGPELAKTLSDIVKGLRTHDFCFVLLLTVDPSWEVQRMELENTHFFLYTSLHNI